MVTILELRLTIRNLLPSNLPMSLYEFPYVKISQRILNAVGLPEEDTRIFRMGGASYGFQGWLEDLHKLIGEPLVPTNWVPALVGVSRAAVHKRIKSGRLTVFLFEHREHEKNIVGNTVERQKGEYDFCVVSECIAWKEEIEQREARKNPPKWKK